MIETADYRTPAVEIMEREEGRTEDEIRAAREKCLELLNSFAVEVIDALNKPNATLSEVACATYSPAFALGLMATGGASMTEIAQRFNVTRAAISKRSVIFSRIHGLQASFSMKRGESRRNYRKAREDVVRESRQQ